MSAEETRRRIVDAALRLFETQGYAGTTMRAVAAEAGVAPSHAYYFFAGKDQLVQELYERIQRDHRARAGDALAGGGSLAERLLAVERAYLEVVEPYHSFGQAFVSTALVPGAAASPLSEESGPARELSRAIYAEVVDGAEPRVPRRLAAVLPDLLWLSHLLLTLHWVVDETPGTRRTHLLVERSVAMLAQAVRVSRLPGAASLVDRVAGVLDVVVPGR